jgi:hypothetical protein
LRPVALSAALAGLPEQFALGASSDVVRVPAPRASADDMRALQDALAALGQVLRLFPRATDDDVRPSRRGRRHAHGHAMDKAAASSRDRDRPRARARTRERDREPEVERELEPEPAAEADGGAPGVLRSLEAKPRLRASLLRHGGPRAPQAGAGIEKGAKVRVLEGPFAGKEGLVQELDGNGGARVMLGLLAVRIDVKDLISSALGRGRPKLSSSHRRPVPVRS